MLKIFSDNEPDIMALFEIITRRIDNNRGQRIRQQVIFIFFSNI